MKRIDRRSALKIGFAAASAGLVREAAAQTSDALTGTDTSPWPGVVMRKYGESPSIIPGIKTVSMRDIIMQPGSKTAGPPMPNPAKPEPNRIRSTHQTSAVGGTVEATAERALPRAPRRGALVLRPDHRHRYVARGVLCKRDDGISVGAADPHLRLSAICRAAS